ncbi:MAG: Hsp20/alpha crystallin family protein [Candidatus Bathyarchaeota archaeon]|nr:MAG: Hsp20/alpha crystallin family protein [Candidatus Bathyarchaeota archaeon]
MFRDEDFERWFKRKMRSPFSRGWFFEDIEEVLQDIEEMMNRELKKFTSRVPKDYVRERKLPDGRKVRELGPFVYGYSMTISRDGNPVVREFGNVKPSRHGPKIKEECEPLVDVISTDGYVNVVAELPGVEKKDIKLSVMNNILTISVDMPNKKFYKKVKLPVEIEPIGAKTSYKNGVLEIILNAKKCKPKGASIVIE